MTPADKLRARVVTLVLGGILGLSALLYAAIIALLWVEREIPGELWLAAGLFGGALVGLLNNSKGGSEGGSGPLTVTTEPGRSLAVHPVDRDA